jgi:hypothetical protein
MAYEFVDIREHWDVVKKGLMEIHEQVDPDWRPEDVYVSCVNGDSHLMMDPARTTTGFCIVQSIPIPFRKASKLLIWIGYDPVPESAVTYAEELETLARNTGHESIEVWTPHTGLSELAQSFGYDFKYHVVNKRL